MLLESLSRFQLYQRCPFDGQDNVKMMLEAQWFQSRRNAVSTCDAPSWSVHWQHAQAACVWCESPNLTQWGMRQIPASPLTADDRSLLPEATEMIPWEASPQEEVGITGRLLFEG